MSSIYHPKCPPLEDAARRYQEAAELAGNVPRWLQQQGVILGDFLAFLAPLGLKHLGDLQPQHLTAFLVAGLRDGRGALTLRRKAIVCRAWARWCQRAGLVSHCPLVDADLPPARQVPREAPALVDLVALASREPHPDYRAAFLLLALTGARRAEILMLRWEDIDLHRGLVLIRQRADWSPKTRRDRAVQLLPEALPILQIRRGLPHCERGPFLGEDGPLFHPSTLSHRWLALMKREGFRVRLHDLRHAFIRAAVQRANLRDVQLHAGHQSIQTTERYLGPDARASGRVIEAMGGLLPELGKLAT